MTFALTMGMIVATLGITSEVDLAEMGQAEDSALAHMILKRKLLIEHMP